MEEEKIFERRWQLASNEQKARYKNLISSYPAVDWSYKEKKYLLWLCQLDIDTFKTFEVILDKMGIRIIVWKKFIVNCCLYNRKSDNCVENYFLQPYDK